MCGVRAWRACMCGVRRGTGTRRSVTLPPLHPPHPDSPSDLSALARHVAERPPPAPPLWRQQRPSLLLERAAFEPSTADASAAAAAAAPADAAAGAASPGPASLAAAAAAGGDGSGGVVGALTLWAYVRGVGLSANQLVTLPGCGDFRIEAVHGPSDPHAAATAAAAQRAAVGLAGGAAGAVGGGRGGAGREKG
jgi:hypothetical protein